MLGENIKKIRESKNISQKDLAEAVQLSPKTIQNYEQGVRSPRYEQIKDIAQALGVTEQNLLMIEGNIEIDSTQLFLEKLSSEISDQLWEISVAEKRIKEQKDSIRWKTNLLKEIERITGKEIESVNFKYEDIPFLCTELENLLLGGLTVDAICERWQISKTAFYQWVEEYPQFKESFRKAQTSKEVEPVDYENEDIPFTYNEEDDGGDIIY